MKTVMSVLCALLIFASLAKPAFANTGPGPNIVLAELLMAIVLWALTAAGGGYAIKKMKKPGKGIGAWELALGVFIVAPLSVMLSVVLPVTLLILPAWGIKRGWDMQKWSREARSADRSALPADASPRRLALVGVILIILMIAIPVAAVWRDATSNPYAVRGYNAAAHSDIRNLNTNLMAHFEDTKAYPDSVESVSDKDKEYRLYKATAGGKDLKVNWGGPSRNVEVTYKKTAKEAYVLNAMHAKGDREYKLGSEDYVVYFRKKEDKEGQWEKL